MIKDYETNEEITRSIHKTSDKTIINAEFITIL